MEERPHSSPQPPGFTPGLRLHCAGPEPRWLWRRVREYQRPNEEPQPLYRGPGAPHERLQLSSVVDTWEYKRIRRRRAGLLHLIPKR